MLVGLPTAQAADTTLTLACQGTTTVTTMEGAKPEPVSMGIIVNFTKNTVHGFGHPGWSTPSHQRYRKRIPIAGFDAERCTETHGFMVE